MSTHKEGISKAMGGSRINKSMEGHLPNMT